MKITSVAVTMLGECRHHHNAFREAVGLTNSLEDGGGFQDAVRRCQKACLRHFEQFGYPVIDRGSGEQ
jgi:hypothetical protein